MLKQTVVGLGFVLLAQQAGAGEMSSLQQCKAEFADSAFDCACVVKFLEPRFDRGDVDLLMAIWTYSLDGRRDHSGDFQSLYRQHGHQNITQLLLQFHRYRVALLMQCPEDGPAGEDDY